MDHHQVQSEKMSSTNSSSHPDTFMRTKALSASVYCSTSKETLASRGITVQRAVNYEWNTGDSHKNQLLSRIKNIGYFSKTVKYTPEGRKYSSYIEAIPYLFLAKLKNLEQYNFVDISNRSDLIKEIEFSQTGFTRKANRELKLLQLDALLYIHITEPVLHSNRSTWKDDYNSYVLVNMTLSAAIVHIESGQSVTFTEKSDQRVYSDKLTAKK